MNKTDLIAIRDYIEADKNFIYSTWLRGLYYGDSWFKEIKKNTFMTYYHKVLDHIFNNPNLTVKIACLKDDPEVILGYCVYRGGRVDWLFVKKAWRGIGIAKSLIPQDTHTVTHLTKVGLSMIRKHPSVEFNPFAIN